VSNDCNSEKRIKAAVQHIDRIMAGDLKEPFPRTELLKVFLDAVKAEDRTALFAMSMMAYDLPENSNISISWLFEIAFKEMISESRTASQPVELTVLQQRILKAFPESGEQRSLRDVAEEVGISMEEALYSLRIMATALLVVHEQTPKGYRWRRITDTGRAVLEELDGKVSLRKSCESGRTRKIAFDDLKRRIVQILRQTQGSIDEELLAGQMNEPIKDVHAALCVLEYQEDSPVEQDQQTGRWRATDPYVL
jgi:DNA-binding MarR family transcriptional regulator